MNFMIFLYFCVGKEANTIIIHYNYGKDIQRSRP